MPVDIRIKFDTRLIAKDMQKIRRRVLPKAARQALNKVLTTAATQVRKEISETTGLTQKEIRKGTQLFRARGSNLDAMSAAINMRNAKAVNLARFVSRNHAKPSGGAGQPQHFRALSKSRRRPKRYLRKGVRSRAWRKLKTYDGTFIARGRSGNVVALRRESSGRRSKIVGVVGPSPRLEFNRKDLRKRVGATIRRRWPIEMDRAVRLGLSRLR